MKQDREGVPGVESPPAPPMSQAVTARSHAILPHTETRCKAIPTIDAVAEFILYCRVERGLAENSIKSYARALNVFLDYCRKRQARAMHTDKITPEVIARFRRWHGKRKRPSSATALHLATVLRVFLRFAYENSYTVENVAPFIDLPMREVKLPVILLVEEVERMLNLPAHTPTEERDGTMIEVLYASACRASELRHAQVEDISFSDCSFRINCGKGGKDRVIPLHKCALAVVRDYLDRVRPQLMPEPGERHLFLSVRGKPLCREDVWRTVKRVAQRAGIQKRVYPHVLRHSCATHLMEAGMDILPISQMLGHSDVSTTQIYTHIDRKHLFAAWRKYHPRATDPVDFGAFI